MTGWVSFALMGLYGNVGEVEDGMNTLAHAHALTDAPGAVPLREREGHPLRGRDLRLRPRRGRRGQRRRRRT